MPALSSPNFLSSGKGVTVFGLQAIIKQWDLNPRTKLQPLRKEMMSPYLLEVRIEMFTTNLIVFHGLLQNNLRWGKEVAKIRLTIHW